MSEDRGDEMELAGFVPPDPDEPPPVELWRAVGDVPAWGSLLMLLSWGALFALMAFRHQLGDDAAYLARGASVTERDPLDAAWRLLASTFLHAGAAHLLFNAASLLIFAPAVERLFARGGFWIVYAAGGALASLASLLWRTWRFGVGSSLSVGASGAIFALGGALLAAAFRLRRRLAVGRARALGAAMLFLVAQGLAGGFERNGTDNVAHGAGLLAGMALGMMIPMSDRLGGPAGGALTRAGGALAALALAACFVRAMVGG